jgi:hypothetical protein
VRRIAGVLIVGRRQLFARALSRDTNKIPHDHRNWREIFFIALPRKIRLLRQTPLSWENPRLLAPGSESVLPRPAI